MKRVPELLKSAHILRSLASASAVVAAGLTMSVPSVAQTPFPNRPVALVVPYPAGGSADTIARLVGERAGAALGQPVVVQNRPGGSSAVGLNAVNAAAADGHTLFLAASTLTTQAAVNRTFALALDKQLIPLVEVVRGPFLIAANLSVQAGTVKELVDQSRQNPDVLNYASVGIASSVHFTMEAFKAATGAKLTHVPFSGSAPALNATLANQVQLMADPVFLLKNQIDLGRLKPIAVTGSTRSPLLPNVPTVAEAGYPGFDLRFWIGMFVKEGTPEALGQRLHAAFSGAIQDAEMSKRLAGMGFEPVGGAQREFQARIRSELATWAKVVRDNNLTVE